MYFSETLSWDLQVDHVSKNIAKAIGVLCRTRDILPIRVKYMLYNSLLACHLQYCNLVWASTTLVNIQKLLRLQKRAIRIVAGESYLAHTAPLFEKFKIMKFDKLYDYNIVRLYRHYQKGKIYNDTLSTLTLTDPTYQSRRGSRWEETRVRTNLGMQSVKCSMPKILNYFLDKGVCIDSCSDSKLKSILENN